MIQKVYHILQAGCLFLLIAFVAGPAVAASPNDDEKEVAAAVQLYINGTSFNIPKDIEEAFYPDARLYLDGKEGSIWELSSTEYAKLFSGAKQSQFNGRIGRLISIDMSDDIGIATAKAEILLVSTGRRFTDLFLLKKIKGKWQIVSKTAASRSGPEHGRKVALVVSNAERYPGTTISAGNNFPELAYTYHALRRAGYAVDVISPQGGAIALEAINFSDPLQKRHLYDRDFMWALSHTRQAVDTRAADYAGIVYAGGGAAILGVPDDPALQALAVAIYAGQGGVIAAICHGTQGLSNLKNGDGTYLISGKVLTSFPDQFLNKQSPIFKAYPFSAEGTIRERGGIFRHGASGASHVEVDGRLVTGMNWESSSAVVEAMIALMERKQP